MDVDKASNKETYTRMIQKLLFKEVIGIIVVMCIVAMGCGTVFAVSSNSNSMENILNSYQREIDSYIAAVKGKAETFALSMASGSVVGYERELAVAQTIADSDERISAVYYCRNDESLVYFSSASGAWLPDKGDIFTDRNWYVGALKGDVYLSDPYVDEVSGQFCITISKSVEIGGKTAGVIGFDFLLGGITELVESSDVGNGYLILASSEGIIMVHPNEEFALSEDNSVSMEDAVNGNYKNLIRKPGESRIFIDYAGGIKIAVANQSTVSGWYLTIVKPLLSVYLGIFVLGAVLLVLGAAACILFAEYNRKRCQAWFAPIEDVSGIVPELAAGNLNIHFEDAAGIEEIEVLNSSLNKTVEQLQYYIEDISKIVDGIAGYDLSMMVDGEYKGDFADIQNGLNSILKQLNSVFLQTDGKADMVLSYAQQIRQSSETVATGATEQASAVSKLSEDMEELNGSLQSVMGSMDVAMLDVERSGEQLSEGGRKMEELEAAIQVIEDTTNMIDDIMASIEEIAEQTNLLSLNASIEAARVGEAGKGFAVVAAEINTLSVSCAQASSKTSKLVQESKKAVETGRRLSKDTVKKLQEGILAAQTSYESVAQMKEVLRVQKEELAAINTLANEIAGVVESNAAFAQENAASGADLILCAQEMKDSVKRFKLRRTEL